MSDTPYESNAKDKVDVLDWDKLPPGECDLNFRKPNSHQPSDLRRTLWTLLKVAGVTILLGLIVRTRFIEGFFTAEAARTAIFIGFVLFMFVLVGWFRVMPISGAPPDAFIAAVAAFVLIVLLWFAAGMLTTAPAGGLLLLLSAALPVTAYAADSIATHWLYWCTANPRVDRATMTGWREDWSRRFWRVTDRPLRDDVSDPRAPQAHQQAMRLLRSYPGGFLWLAATFFGVPAVVGALTIQGTVKRTELWTVAEITLVLLWLAVVRGLQAPGSWWSFRRAFASWGNYGRDANDPPWVFRSPCGPQLYRVCVAVFAVVLLTVSVFTLLSDSLNRAVNHLAAVPEIDAPAVLGLLIPLAATVAVPLLWFVLSSYIVTAPVLGAVELACEADGGFERHSDWSELDGYFERLRNSRNPEERRHMLAGYNPTHGYPYLLDSDLLFEHLHMLGATGIGKTALGLATHTIQLIRRDDGPVVIVDCKGDPAFFHTARIEAEKAGRTFKWFTNKPHLSTYVFNPLDQPHLRRLSLPDMIGLITQSLNLHHGDDYGRAWFSIGARVLLKAALLASAPQGSAWAQRGGRYSVGQHPPVQSFRDLETILSVIAGDDEEYKAGKHLLFLVESLADFEQLNLASNRAANHPALRHAIHMPEVIAQKQVVYFYLVGAMDLASVGELARLVLYSALSAAIAHRDRTGKRPRVYFVADEAQALAILIWFVLSAFQPVFF